MILTRKGEQRLTTTFFMVVNGAVDMNTDGCHSMVINRGGSVWSTGCNEHGMANLEMERE